MAEASDLQQQMAESDLQQRLDAQAQLIEQLQTQIQQMKQINAQAQLIQELQAQLQQLQSKQPEICSGKARRTRNVDDESTVATASMHSDDDSIGLESGCASAGCSFYSAESLSISGIFKATKEAVISWFTATTFEEEEKEKEKIKYVTTYPSRGGSDLSSIGKDDASDFAKGFEVTYESVDLNENEELAKDSSKIMTVTSEKASGENDEVESTKSEKDTTIAPSSQVHSSAELENSDFSEGYELPTEMDALNEMKELSRKASKTMTTTSEKTNDEVEPTKTANDEVEYTESENDASTSPSSQVRSSPELEPSDFAKGYEVPNEMVDLRENEELSREGSETITNTSENASDAIETTKSGHDEVESTKSEKDVTTLPSAEVECQRTVTLAEESQESVALQAESRCQEAEEQKAKRAALQEKQAEAASLASTIAEAKRIVAQETQAKATVVAKEKRNFLEGKRRKSEEAAQAKREALEENRRLDDQRRQQAAGGRQEAPPMSANDAAITTSSQTLASSDEHVSRRKWRLRPFRPVEDNTLFPSDSHSKRQKKKRKTRKLDLITPPKDRTEESLPFSRGWLEIEMFLDDTQQIVLISDDGFLSATSVFVLSSDTTNDESTIPTEHDDFEANPCIICMQDIPGIFGCSRNVQGESSVISNERSSVPPMIDESSLKEMLLAAKAYSVEDTYISLQIDRTRVEEEIIVASLISMDAEEDHASVSKSETQETESGTIDATKSTDSTHNPKPTLLNRIKRSFQKKKNKEIESEECELREKPDISTTDVQSNQPVIASNESQVSIQTTDSSIGTTGMTSSVLVTSSEQLLNSESEEEEIAITSQIDGDNAALIPTVPLNDSDDELKETREGNHSVGKSMSEKSLVSLGTGKEGNAQDSWFSPSRSSISAGDERESFDSGGEEQNELMNNDWSGVKDPTNDMSTDYVDVEPDSIPSRSDELKESGAGIGATAKQFLESIFSLSTHVEADQRNDAEFPEQLLDMSRSLDPIVEEQADELSSSSIGATSAHKSTNEATVSDALTCMSSKDEYLNETQSKDSLQPKLRSRSKEHTSKELLELETAIYDLAEPFHMLEVEDIQELSLPKSSLSDMIDPIHVVNMFNPESGDSQSVPDTSDSNNADDPSLRDTFLGSTMNVLNFFNTKTVNPKDENDSVSIDQGPKMPTKHTDAMESSMSDESPSTTAVKESPQETNKTLTLDMPTESSIEVTVPETPTREPKRTTLRKKVGRSMSKIGLRNKSSKKKSPKQKKVKSTDKTETSSKHVARLPDQTKMLPQKDATGSKKKVSTEKSHRNESSRGTQAVPVFEVETVYRPRARKRQASSLADMVKQDNLTTSIKSPSGDESRVPSSTRLLSEEQERESANLFQ